MEEKITLYDYNRKIALLACSVGTLSLYCHSEGATKDLVIFSSSSIVCTRGLFSGSEDPLQISDTS